MELTVFFKGLYPSCKAGYLKLVSINSWIGANYFHCNIKITCVRFDQVWSPLLRLRWRIIVTHAISCNSRMVLWGRKRRCCSILELRTWDGRWWGQISWNIQVHALLRLRCYWHSLYAGRAAQYSDAELHALPVRDKHSDWSQTAGVCRRAAVGSHGGVASRLWLGEWSEHFLWSQNSVRLLPATPFPSRSEMCSVSGHHFPAL